MGKKGRHTQDKLFISATEWANEYGGKKAAGSSSSSRPLPFDHCALSLGPFETPVCTREGVMFDLMNLVPYIRKHKANPVSGEPMTSQDIIRLNMQKNADGLWHCPVTYKVFNDQSHIVAVRTTGNVYAYDAVLELNIKPKKYVDLLTDEPFERAAIITLQDPTNEAVTKKRDISSFTHLKTVREDAAAARLNQGSVRTNTTGESVMREIERKRKLEAEEGVKKRTLEDMKSEVIEYTDDVASLLALGATTGDVNPGFEDTDGRASWALTSTYAATTTSNASRPATAKDIREARWQKLRLLGKKGFVQLQTSHGNLNLELHCDIAQRACYNFVALCRSGYYDDTVFHRLVPKFMVQGGDPTGTGTGGQSMWKAPFRDEFDNRIWHDARGVVSMANSGPGTNGSQFFITLRDCAHLNNKHSVFARVVGGLAALQRIEEVGSNSEERPLTDIKLLRAVVFSDPYEEVDAALTQEISERMQARLAAMAQTALPSSAPKVGSKAPLVSYGDDDDGGADTMHGRGGSDKVHAPEGDQRSVKQARVADRTPPEVAVGRFLSSSSSHSGGGGAPVSLKAKAASGGSRDDDAVARFLSSQSKQSATREPSKATSKKSYGNFSNW